MAYLSVSLTCRSDDAQSLLRRCSRLFNSELRYIIDRVIRESQPQYTLPGKISRIVIDLGEMPLAEFESRFCQRLANQLESAFTNYPADCRGLSRPDCKPLEAIPISTPQGGASCNLDDSATLFQRYLQSGYWPRPEDWLNEGSVDAWLTAQRQAAPRLWQDLIALACLSPGPRRRLWQLLTPTTLGNCLEIAEPATQHALLLGALQYFQQNPRQDASLPPVEVEVLLPLVLANGPFLERLFSTPSPVSLTPWLRSLWRHPPLRIWLDGRLSGARVAQLQRTLAEPVRTGNEVEQVASLQAMPAEPEGAGDELERIASRKATPRPLDLTRMQVSNAGLSLLWPLFPDLFTRLGLWGKDHFACTQSQINAACWLDALIWADDCAHEWRMPLTKWLCGLPLDCEIEWQAPDEETAGKLYGWLPMLSKQLPGWRTLSTHDIRTLFLQRPGELVKTEASLKLTVQREPFDILLNDWPWPLDQLMLPWLEKPLSIDWL